MKPETRRPDGAPTSGTTRATTSSAESLREKARQAIAAGELPGRRPDRTWGGPGAGSYCTICSAPVQSDEVELEIEFARGDNGAGFDKHHVHFRCFAAFEVELRDVEPNGSRRVLPETGKKRHNGVRGDDSYRRGSA